MSQKEQVKQPEITDEITLSREVLERAIVAEIQDYFSGTDWQNSLESGGPLIARYVLGRVLRYPAARGIPEEC